MCGRLCNGSEEGSSLLSIDLIISFNNDNYIVNINRDYISI